MAKKMTCTSCGVSLLGDDKYTKFQCPACGEEEIMRCSSCKKLSNPYKCNKCGFEGP